MAQRIALTILSIFRTNGQNDEVSYTFKDDRARLPQGKGVQYRGVLTNVAPMECLIDLAVAEGRPINKIVYLRSKEAHGTAEELPNGECLTPEAYFRKEIFKYYQSFGDDLDCGPKSEDDDEFFVGLNYHKDEPTRSLQDIVYAVGTGQVLVDVDTTGGQRDATVLTTIAIQVIKTRYSLPGVSMEPMRVGLGNTVYASKEWDQPEGSISLQDRTYDLVDLANAVEAFTRYGKAQLLYDFFQRDSGGRKTSAQLVNLLTIMKEFSDDLAICNVREVPEHVRKIHERIHKLELHHASAVPDSVSRAELLFMSLLSGLKEDFVKETGRVPTKSQAAQQTIDIIRWCVSRQLLQQALSLVREFYPRCMWQLGYIDWGNGLSYWSNPSERDENNERISRIEQLAYHRVLRKPKLEPQRAIDFGAVEYHTSECKREYPSLPDGEDGKRVCVTLLPDLVVKHSHVQIQPNAVRILPAMLIWYQTILTIRNEIMHANPEDSKDERQRRYQVYANVVKNASEIRCSYDSAGDRLDGLSKDINKALDALEGKIVLEYKLLGHDTRERVEVKAPQKPAQVTSESKEEDPELRRIEEAIEASGGDVMLWEELFPTEEDEPDDVRKGKKSRQQYLEELSEGASTRLQYVSTIVVDGNAASPQNGNKRQGCLEAKDYLLNEAPQIRPGVVLFQDASSTERGRQLLKKKALGMKLKDRRSIGEYLSIQYPKVITEGAGAVRLKKR